MFQINTIFAALLVTLLFTGCAATKTADVADYSGYIGDYDGLEKTTDELGHEVLRWQSSDFITGVYETLMIDDIVFYPAGKATAQISEELLIEIREYSNAVLLHEVSKVVPVTNQPGPDVLRMRMAITGVSTSAEGLKAYEYIPVAAIAAGVTSATGARNREVFFIVETELLDSMTGERMFIEVFKQKAKKLIENDTQQVTLDSVRDLIDDGAAQSRMFFENLIAK
jgi:hypothetical protein